MGRKRVLKIPKTVTIKCPFCEKNTRFKVEVNSGIQSIECNKCKQIINTPASQCCVICAFSDKKCPYSLAEEANAKGLKIRQNI